MQFLSKVSIFVGVLCAHLFLSTPGVADSQITIKTAQKGEVRINYLVQGDGPIIVLLPSLGRSADDFDDVANRLARAGYRVVRPQPRGIGGSVGPLTGLTLHDFASDVAMVIVQESSEPVVVAGHAFGNWVARTLAADAPKLVRGVAILASGTKVRKASKELTEAVLKSFDPAVSAEQRLKYLKLVFFAPGSDASVWLDLTHSSGALAKAEFAAAKATPEKEWWTAGTVRLLDVVAGDDKLRPPSSRDEIKNDLGAGRVTVVVIPNAGHALIPEQPAAVVDALVAWIKTL